MLSWRVAQPCLDVTSLLLVAGFIGSSSVAASPVGLWKAEDGAIIRVAPCGANLCAFIAKPSPAIDPQTGRPPTDKHNSDPAKRNRPLAGVAVLMGMRAVEPAKWSGRLYNDDDGQTYMGNLIEIDAAKIRIEGCSVGVCGGNTLSRMK